MRTRILPGWVGGIVLAAGVVTAGWAQDRPAAGTASVSPGKIGAGVPAPAATAESGAPANKSAQAKLDLSLGSLDVQKLAQAQVEEGVLLAYVTNSSSVFDLSAGDIIDLKNAGVPERVLNAMIEHDRALLSTARAAAVVAVPKVTAVAPSLAKVEPEAAVKDESWADESFLVEDDYYAPEQPADIGPVRAPYPVKLNDPIVILKLPSLTVPYW